MGSPLSSIIAEIFLQHIDTKIQNIIKTHDPDGIWIRYVDDGLYVSNNKNTNAENILKQINKIHPKIHFTEKKEKHTQINYFDITITRYNNHLSLIHI